MASHYIDVPFLGWKRLLCVCPDAQQSLWNGWLDKAHFMNLACASKCVFTSAFICALIKLQFLQDGQAVWRRAAQHWQPFITLHRCCKKTGLNGKALRQRFQCIYIIFRLLDLVRVQPSKQGFAACKSFSALTRVCSLKRLLFVIFMCPRLINQSWISFWQAVFSDMIMYNSKYKPINSFNPMAFKLEAETFESAL